MSTLRNELRFCVFGVRRALTDLEFMFEGNLDGAETSSWSLVGDGTERKFVKEWKECRMCFHQVSNTLA